MKKINIFFTVILMIASCSLTAQVRISKENIPPHPSAMLQVQDTAGGLLIPRMTQAQRDLIISPANGLMIYQTNGTNGFYYFDGIGWTRAGEHSGHYVGESFGGGIIFYLNEDGKHGLIVSMVDLSAAQAWSNINNVLIGPTAQSAWNGPGNSTAIVNQQGHTNSAAQLCINYVNDTYGTGIFTDWYLPSTGEARHLANNIYQVQKTLESDGNPATTAITDGIYWTSTEESATSAWGCYIVPGGDSDSIARSFTRPVRAVRAFNY